MASLHKIDIGYLDIPHPKKGHDRMVISQALHPVSHLLLDRLVVLDGAGTAEASEVAHDALQNLTDLRPDTFPYSPRRTIAFLQREVMKACAGLAFTTVAVVDLWCSPGRPGVPMEFAAVGDSPIVLFQPRQGGFGFGRLTHDEGHVAGVTTTYVDTFVGSPNHAVSQYGGHFLNTGDAVAVFSDGLGYEKGPVTPFHLRRILSGPESAQQAADGLREFTDGNDDVSAIIAKIGPISSV